MWAAVLIESLVPTQPPPAFLIPGHPKKFWVSTRPQGLYQS